MLRYSFDASGLSTDRKEQPAGDNDFMRYIGLLLAAVIGIGVYYYFLKRAAPAQGQVATQAISTTGVEMDLNAIAQAERVYFAQNGSYADLDTLTSSGAMNITRTGRDGYAYSVDAGGSTFTATATHPDSPAMNGVAPLHYPQISIDQTMQLRQQ